MSNQNFFSTKKKSEICFCMKKKIHFWKKRLGGREVCMSLHIDRDGILFNFFRLILNQTEFRLVPDLSADAFIQSSLMQSSLIIKYFHCPLLAIPWCQLALFHILMYILLHQIYIYQNIYIRQLGICKISHKYNQVQTIFLVNFQK